MSYMLTGPDGNESGPYEIQQLQQWAAQNRMPPNAPVRNIETGVTTQAIDVPELKLSFPPMVQAPKASSGTAMIPSDNPDALWSYYLGILALFCGCSFILGPISIIKGKRALERCESEPELHGKTHAKIGIVLSYIGLIGSVLLGALIFASVYA